MYYKPKNFIHGGSNMLHIKEINNEDELNKLMSKQTFVDFLHTHLGKFGDSKKAITKSVDYAFSDESGKGGFLLVAYNDGELIGALVMNFTGMTLYIPENLLVYVAVHSKCRGKGFGKKIIEKAISIADGDVALHVEYDNPAKRLYERIGFTSKYADMRYIRDK